MLQAAKWNRLKQAGQQAKSRAGFGQNLAVAVGRAACNIQGCKAAGVMKTLGRLSWPAVAGVNT